MSNYRRVGCKMDACNNEILSLYVVNVFISRCAGSEFETFTFNFNKHIVIELDLIYYYNILSYSRYK